MVSDMESSVYGRGKGGSNKDGGENMTGGNMHPPNWFIGVDRASEIPRLVRVVGSYLEGADRWAKKSEVQ
jgi:hypothetical protein